MKFEDVKVPHTRLIEVDLQKPRNLSAHESEEYDHGEGVGVYPTLLQSDTPYP